MVYSQNSYRQIIAFGPGQKCCLAKTSLVDSAVTLVFQWGFGLSAKHFS